MTPNQSFNCSILLLAGGQGRRVGGQDKGLIDWHGKPLITWVHQVARPLTDEILISCNRNQQRYASYADRLVADQEPDFPGPLTGIRAGLAAASHSQMLVLPCDTPLVDTALLTQLLAYAYEEPSLPVMLRRGNQWEPLFCVIPAGLATDIEQAWHAGERSNREILLRLGARSLDIRKDDPRLANLNSPVLLAAQSPRQGT